MPDIFGLDDVSLMQVLDNTNGTALNSASGNLLRAATTALLNAGHPDVDYPLTSQQIINNTNTALATLNNKTISNLTKTLNKYNNRYCPLNAVPVNPSITVQEDPLTVSVSELQVKAFPNPSSGLYNIQIESTLKDKISVRVIDIQGRLVDQRQNVQPNQILRIGENYVPGIYFLQVEQGYQRKQLKLIKMK